MFAQFRSQYPQGRIQTEMLPKIDGLHAFRAIVSQGDDIMGTATAVDSDLEIAEDRAIKRALTIAGISFDNSFDSSYGSYGGRSPILTQVSRETSAVNSLPSANFNPVANLSAGHSERPAMTHTTHTIQSEPAIEYAGEYAPEPNFHYGAEPEIEPPTPYSEPVVTDPKPSAPQLSAEPVDLSDAISKIDVEMQRLSWTKTQGRDYLVRTFDKKSRQQLTNDELLQFLSHLKSLPTPHRQSSSANDDFF
ncbi:hypothetical protein H6F42_06525 [Pseudanabaena sp. FACHB-1998]|nr:hypothetical protein [Pseudanabaena sp. FACHB-1998]